MDSVFYLSPLALQVFMKNSLEPLGWAYMVLWFMDPTAKRLLCKDGWYNCTSDVGEFLFGLYKMCHFEADVGIPGLAYNRPPLLWLTGSQLLQFSCDRHPGTFLQGSRNPVFLPCGLGVIEMGTKDMIAADEQSISLVSGRLLSLLSPPLGSASSSSSAFESPESSSIVSANFLDLAPSVELETQIRIPEMDSSGFCSFPVFLQPQLRSSYPSTAQQSLRIFSQSAFSRWTAQEESSNLQRIQSLPGQFALKRCIEMLQRMYRAERIQQMSSTLLMGGSSSSSKPQATTPAVSSSSQLHHMISERRRREKLKESFEALRSFFPPNSKKDKASILENTKNYLSSLKTRVEELERMNQQLDSELRRVTTSDFHEEGSLSQFQRSPVTGGGLSSECNDVSVSCSDDKLLVDVKMERIPPSTVDTISELLKHFRDGRFCVMSTSATASRPNGPFTFHASIKANIEGTTPDELQSLKNDLRIKLQSTVRTLQEHSDK